MSRCWLPGQSLSTWNKSSRCRHSSFCCGIIVEATRVKTATESINTESLSRKMVSVGECSSTLFARATADGNDSTSLRRFRCATYVSTR